MSQITLSNNTSSAAGFAKKTWNSFKKKKIKPGSLKRKSRISARTLDSIRTLNRNLRVEYIAKILCKKKYLPTYVFKCTLGVLISFKCDIE